MLTEKDYCDYETCVALKELGYNRGAYAYYFPNHKDDLIFNTHQMRGCSINEMLKGYNTYPKDVVGHELIDAPTLWEAQKWLREGKGIFVMIEAPWKTDDGLGWSYLCCNKPLTEEDQEVCVASGGFYDSYEEALLEGIKASVKILKEK